MNSYTSKLLGRPKLLASAVLISSPIAYLIYLHRSLSKSTHHGKESKRLTSSMKEHISSFPETAFSSEHVMVHDWAHRSIPASKVPALSQEQLITLYLRHNMSLFSRRFPQAYLLRLISTQENRRTFNLTYISTLDFKEGDIVNSLYRVVARNGGKVEFELAPMGIVKGGRMVIGVERRGEELICSGRTVMWKEAEEKGSMPLERAGPRWLHEVASWWLLDSGTRFLMGMRKES